MKKWLYFLVDDQGRSYKKNGSVIQQVSQPTSLPNSPDGWQDISIGWERNMNRFGIIRNFSLPLGFVKDSADILNHIYLTGNVETKVYLLIKKLEVELTPTTYRMIYRYFYKGELDLSTVEISDSKTTVNIMEGGLSKDLAANEATTFEFPLDDPEAEDALMDGMTVRTTFNYRTLKTEVDTSFTGPIVFPIGFINQEGFNDETITHNDTFFEFLSLPDLVPDKSVSFFSNTYPPGFEYRVKGSFILNVTGTDQTIEIRFQSHNRGSTIYTQSVHIITAASYPTGSHTIDFDFTITVPAPIIAPESVYVELSYFPDAASTFTIETSDLYVSFIYRKRPTIVPFFTPDVLFRKLIGKITGSEADAASDLLALNKEFVVTCGDALRGLAGATIKTSLKDFFDAYNAWLNAGMSIENKKIRFESKSRYFDTSATPFNLGGIKNLRITTATDLMCNTIKVGYPEQDTNEAWGKYEFNNTSQYTTPVKKVVKDFSLISSYRTDPSGIEITRINLEGKSTTDANTDNDVFALSIDYANPNIDGTYNLNRPAFTVMDGIPTESQASVFNIEFSPRRIFNTHANWISGLFKGFETSKIIFQTTQKNRNLRTILSGFIVEEDGNIVIGNMTSPLIQPKYLEFECKSPKLIVNALETTPNIPFTAVDGFGNTITGFLIKAGISPDSNKEQTIKLLASTNLDITTLI